MTTRRTFLAGLAAAGLCPRPTWADAGAPAYLSAARMPDGRYYLVGLTTRGGELFRLPIPARSPMPLNGSTNYQISAVPARGLLIIILKPRCNRPY